MWRKTIALQAAAQLAKWLATHADHTATNKMSNKIYKKIKEINKNYNSNESHFASVLQLLYAQYVRGKNRRQKPGFAWRLCKKVSLDHPHTHLIYQYVCV